MSHYDYQASKHISGEDHPFYALVMAAMRQADDENLNKLVIAFPDTYYELCTRYNAPGGFLEGERDGSNTNASPGS